MPIDFSTFGSQKKQETIKDPIEIFRALPKSANLIDLHASQAEVLDIWWKRAQRDTVLKLHTGGGKTLVGLLIANSIMAQYGEPVVYLCPNNQLVEQTLALANQYGIDVVPYGKRGELDGHFLDAKAVMICNYHAFFNGNSKFGAPGRSPIKLGGIICDDAHSAFPIIRDQFSIHVTKRENPKLYENLTELFTASFAEIDLSGTYEAVIKRDERTLLEIPYYSWFSRLKDIQKQLTEDVFVSNTLQWLFIRDNLQYCHAFVTGEALTITPLLPLVDLIPAFASATKRVFMSATFPDDGSSVLGFDVDEDAASSPVMSSSLAGVSERMMLIPTITKASQDASDWVKQIVASAAGKVEICILVPSGMAAKSWEGLATYPSTSEAVTDAVRDLQSGSSKGPYVFASRYEGIDLSGRACRILVLDGLPKAVGVYDAYRAAVLSGSRSIDASIAQRIEQGAGRAARGPSDFCVVLLTNDSLVHWITLERNLKLMTSVTRAQLSVGQEVSRSIDNLNDFIGVMQQCLNQDKDWRRYAAKELAERTKEPETFEVDLSEPVLERKVFRIWRDGNHEAAISAIVKFLERTQLDNATRGWLLQLAARIAASWGNHEASAEFQKRAFIANRSLLRPKTVLAYAPITVVDDQIESIFSRLKSYAFRRGILIEFDEAVEPLMREASSGQAEAALDKFARLLGFTSDRPDKKSTGGIGPDLIWFIRPTEAWLIEAKSKKLKKNAFNKDDHGQLLVAREWFYNTYPKTYSCSLVTQVPSGKCTEASQAGEVRSMSEKVLQEMIAQARDAYEEISLAVLEGEALKQRIGQILTSRKLDSAQIYKYLQTLEMC